MNTVNIVKCLLIGFLCQTINGIYTYDKFYNKGMTVDSSDNRPYYTSNVFHSVDYAAKNTTLKLRRFNLNSSKSMPEFIL
jgi:hypothetical protein